MRELGTVASCGFVQLQRTFQELPLHSGGDDEMDISNALGLGRSLRWTDLIEEYRLIILSEAGSGKTTELRTTARELVAQGKSAFFLRLEHIPRDFQIAFEVGTCETFQDWLNSSEEGWLLLDSVDEARLRDPGDFELAIRKLGNSISGAIERTHIVITGRTSAWRPKTDLAFCTAHLPWTNAAVLKDDPQTTDIHKENVHHSDRSAFKVVSIEDLTSDQIAAFATARGIDDSKAFLDAVERADAESFTSRPQDLEELVGFWVDNGRIGSRLELMRNSIDQRLAERDQSRADARPLSVQRAREGARLLAAATTLTQNPRIRVPDGAERSTGLAVQSVLSTWNDRDQATLLARPIFDEEIYGAVRFHHRSVREYLAAEWFAELLKRETSRRKIETLFFRKQYGLDIIVPTLRPILSWLVILDDKILKRARRIAPEVILEGGDPSQLPLDIRRSILHQTCEHMAESATSRGMYDNVAIQRFAQNDLAGDVRSLLEQYASNDDLTFFLLRMVWLGELAEALPEVMRVALSSTAEEYTRIAAFRALKATGTSKDQEHVRERFATESAELKRTWLAELIDGISATGEVVEWLLACLEKVEPQHPYYFDSLRNSVTQFMSAADINYLPELALGLNDFLGRPPVPERIYCEVSQEFEWLVEPASKAVERLVASRHHAALERDVISLMHKFSGMRDHRIDEFQDIKTELSTLVPGWTRLNRSLFWFEVESMREKRRDRLTDWRMASPGLEGSLWRFDESDFEYVAQEVASRKFLDDRLVALSLAFRIYKDAGRPRAWRERLKKTAAGDEVLVDRLNKYLRPPAQCQEERRWKQQEAQWKRQNKVKREKQEKNRADWKKHLEENLKEARATLRNNPGTLTNSLVYLYSQVQDKMPSPKREYNWEALISEFGEQIARFYRDSAVAFWRHHEPQLQSEGAPSRKTPYTAFGLLGLEIEAHETEDWHQSLSATEVERACRYAAFESNGFPTWFPELFGSHPETVSNILMQEVQYELSREESMFYFLYRLSGFGQWSWNVIAPRIYEILRREPKNLEHLRQLLKIVQGSELSDDLLAKLASRKCRTLRDIEHAARWFAVWCGVAPDSAIPTLRNRIEAIVDPKEQTKFAMIFAKDLLGDRSLEKASVRGAFEEPDHLKSLYILMHEYIRYEEDIERAGQGIYSPELRDDAQDARNSLATLLDQAPGKESFLALMDIAQNHRVESSRPWMILKARQKAEREGDIGRWTPLQVREFHEQLERSPENHKELAELAVLRLLDLKYDLEEGDSSIASILRGVKRETEIRKYIGHELRQKACGRYFIPQEEELADAKRPDLRFHGVGFDGPVPVELKLADNWSGPELFERLETQLCCDYLRDHRSNRGIFLLVYRGEKNSWDIPGGSKNENIEQLIKSLQGYWRQISSRFLEVDDITVISIDLTKRTN